MTQAFPRCSVPIPSPEAESAERLYQVENVHHVHGLMQPTKISLFDDFREGRNVHLSTWDGFVRTSSATLRGRSHESPVVLA